MYREQKLRTDSLTRHYLAASTSEQLDRPGKRREGKGGKRGRVRACIADGHHVAHLRVRQKRVPCQNIQGNAQAAAHGDKADKKQCKDCAVKCFHFHTRITSRLVLEA